MDDVAFRLAVENAIASLPSWVARELTNVVFLIEDAPSAEQRTEQGLHPDETLFGLYEGIPLSERGNEPPFLPDIITIFKQPILETYMVEADIRACINNTVWHEVAHYFGHDEEWVEEEEIRRGKLL